MYIAAEHYHFLDVDPTGADMDKVSRATNDILRFILDCQDRGMTDQELLCTWHHVSNTLSVVLDNTAHEVRH